VSFTATLLNACRRADVIRINNQEVTDHRLVTPNRATKQVKYIVFDTYDRMGEDLELRAPAEQLITIDEDGDAEFMDLRNDKHTINLKVSAPLKEDDLVTR
jgi:hypothetical protein